MENIPSIGDLAVDIYSNLPKDIFNSIKEYQNNHKGPIRILEGETE